MVERLIHGQVKPVRETNNANGFPPDVLEKASEIISNWIEKEKVYKGKCRSHYEIGFDKDNDPVVVKIKYNKGGVVQKLNTPKLPLNP
jgi:hypothetical protein